MKNPDAGHGIVEAPIESEQIKKVYGIMSWAYFLGDPLEKKARLRGIELAQITPTDKILEVAVGTGVAFLAILEKVNRDNVVYGIDLTPVMIAKTKRRVSKAGYSNVDLQEGDARHLPFSDETFDVLYNSFMLDLIPVADFAVILKEFHRVLKKGGRLVLVNLSKRDHSPVFYERVYRWAPLLFGGCRPVVMQSFMQEAGFVDVKREFFDTFLASFEVVAGIKA